MSAVGSYILSLQEKADSDSADDRMFAARVLKLIGRAPLSFAELLSVTGLPETRLRVVIERLREQKLVEGDDKKYTLTSTGYRAQFIVAT